MKITHFVALSLAAVLSVACASSSREERSKKALQSLKTSLWIAARTDSHQAAEKQMIENMYIPTAASLYRWTSFNSGTTIRYSIDTKLYGVILGETTIMPLGIIALHQIEAEFHASLENDDKTKIYKVKFALDDLVPKNGKGLIQPSDLALRKAIVASGRDEGQAKLVSLNYDGAYFSGTVLVK